MVVIDSLKFATAMALDRRAHDETIMDSKRLTAQVTTVPYLQQGRKEVVIQYT